MSIQTLPPPFTLSPAELHVIMQWWDRIADQAASGTDKADRSVLKRCATPNEVVCTSAYHRVFNAIKAQHVGTAWSDDHQDRIALLIGVAAHVKKSIAHSLPQRMGQSDETGGTARVSELRFKRLLESPDIDSLYGGLRRTLPLVDHELNITALAEDLFEWNDQVRKRWAYAYFSPITAHAADSAV